jgi:hypothetical protein
MHSIRDIVGNKIKPTNERFGLWLLEENLKDNNLVTDIGNIDYCVGEPKIKDITPITDMFCDNIIVVKVAGFSDCEGDINKTFIVKKEICGSYNSYLRGVFKKFSLAKHGVKAKLPYPLEKSNRVNTPLCKGILEVVHEDMDKIKEKYNEPVAIKYKIELADVKLEELLKELPGILQLLRTEMYYLLDLDVTMDLAGIFNKKEMVQHLIDNFDFRNQNDTYEEGSNVIVDNDKTVGIDCLTCKVWTSRFSRDSSDHFLSSWSSRAMPLSGEHVMSSVT